MCRDARFDRAQLSQVIKHCLGEPRDRGLFESPDEDGPAAEGDDMRKDRNHFYPLSSEVRWLSRSGELPFSNNIAASISDYDKGTCCL